MFTKNKTKQDMQSAFRNKGGPVTQTKTVSRVVTAMLVACALSGTDSMAASTYPPTFTSGLSLNQSWCPNGEYVMYGDLIDRGFSSCTEAGQHVKKLWTELCSPGGDVVAYGCEEPNPTGGIVWTFSPGGSWNPKGSVTVTCSDGGPVQYDPTIGQYCVTPAYAQGPNLGCTDCLVKNPINSATGNKFEVETDYTGGGPFPLKLVRYYNSLAKGDNSAGFGANWTHTYNLRIVANLTLKVVSAQGADGRKIAFNLVGSAYVGDATFVERLERITDGWRLVNAADETEEYDNSGKLRSITNAAGLVQTLDYDASGRLIRVTDPQGRTLTFSRDSLFHVQSVTIPGGGTFVYTYGPDLNRTPYTGSQFPNLLSVTVPGGSTRTYHYEVASFPAHLTGITDENGQRFSTFGYDAAGRATSTTHAGNAGKTTLVHDASTGIRNVSVTAHIDGAQSTTRTYTFQSIEGSARNTGIANPACVECGPPIQVYDANGNRTLLGNWRGFRTRYDSYDLARNLETKRTEGLANDLSVIPNVTRTITTQWHADYRLQTGVAEPFWITTMAYGGPADPNPGNRGNLLSRTLHATTDVDGILGFGASATGTPRNWTYTYNTNGSVLTMDGPRTDASDVTTYTYFANNATCPGANAIGCRGQVESVTNSAGHVTQITEYNAHGQPLTITDPNGLATTLTYDPRQRLTARNAGGETTTYTYDNAGQLTLVTLPDGSFLQYTYDAAHRLTQIADNLGNRITYTLDFAGNRTLEEVRDPANQLAQTRSRVYSNLNRLTQEIGAAGQTTAYGYDNQGNVTSIDGPLAGAVDVTANTYDGLNRLTRVTDPNSGQVNYGYNQRDILVSVSDPRSLATTYSYDGLNNLNQQVSPDTGTTANTYDTAGNLLTQTDAKSQVTTYAYDALNRVTSIAYQGGATHTYQYDQGTNGKGRLTQITEPNSTTSYVYDQKGRLTSETRIINAVSYVTAYSYDAAGRMTGVTYPSGRQVNYTLDSLGRIQSVATTKDSTTHTVVSSTAYRPFGPTQGFTFGNGQTYTRGFDTDGRIASYTLATQSIAVGYDPASRIGFLSDTGTPANTNNYGYDNLDRLTSFTGPSTNQAFGYDGVGNRLTKTVGANTDTYTYDATSNRLTQTAGTNNRTYAYDANGSTTGDSVNTFAYDTRGRMVQAVSSVGTSDYQVNSLGQRVRKTNPQGDTIYHYDAQGRLIAESSTSGQVQKEYIYLGDTPVAVLQ